MTEKRFFLLALVSICAAVVIAVLGEFFQAANLLFNILLALAGVVGGYLTSSYFDKKAERQNLGRYASAGLRLSVDIYDSLKEILEGIEELRKSIDDGTSLSKRDVNLMFDVIAGKISVLQRFSLSANNQWRDVLPPEQIVELSRRERTLELSEDWEVQITEEKLSLQQ